MKEAEKNSNAVNDFRMCAEYWVKLLNDKNSARRCIKEAEVKSTSSEDWTSCSSSWEYILNNKEESKRCLEMAKNLGQNPSLN